jgi:hypothetical protein
VKTVRTVNTVLTVAALLAATVAGCSHGSTQPRATAKPTTTDLYGPPTPAAIAALARVRVATPGKNCGGRALDAGWPTTTAMYPDSTCLRDADRAGHAAFMSFTGRDYDHSAYRIVLATSAEHHLLVSAITASPTGAIRRDAWRCAVPAKPMGVSVFYPGGHVQPSIVFDEHCPATTT